MTALVKCTPRGKAPRGFYEDALSQAEQLYLQEALQVEGLDQEIALLRMRLRQAVTERPEDVELMFRGVELLIRAVVARYRLPRASADALRDSIVMAVRGLSQIAPGEDGGNVHA